MFIEIPSNLDNSSWTDYYTPHVKEVAKWLRNTLRLAVTSLIRPKSPDIVIDHQQVALQCAVRRDLLRTTPMDLRGLPTEIHGVKTSRTFRQVNTPCRHCCITSVCSLLDR
ncbi:hypothetical protein AVEN_172886-1 [Araneus ventricosus]|uniref:Uncharacterized protein n=1 Tax=Araneus ventricosus TaxID=182803 RepID=A0A4Y2UXS7_ARAVE|nr:hypothetical protein AVEN_172886-1 [Araneus ventricosus]